MANGYWKKINEVLCNDQTQEEVWGKGAGITARIKWDQLNQQWVMTVKDLRTQKITRDTEQCGIYMARSLPNDVLINMASQLDQ